MKWLWLLGVEGSGSRVNLGVAWPPTIYLAVRFRNRYRRWGWWW